MRLLTRFYGTVIPYIIELLVCVGYKKHILHITKHSPKYSVHVLAHSALIWVGTGHEGTIFPNVMKVVTIALLHLHTISCNTACPVLKIEKVQSCYRRQRQERETKFEGLHYGYLAL